MASEPAETSGAGKTDSVVFLNFYEDFLGEEKETLTTVLQSCVHKYLNKHFLKVEKKVVTANTVQVALYYLDACDYHLCPGNLCLNQDIRLWLSTCLASVKVPYPAL